MAEKSLFEKLYAAGSETIDLARKPLAERQLKRMFQTAYDNAVTARLEAEIKIADAQEDLKNYNLQKVLQSKKEIENADYTMKAISDHYVEMFGEALNSK